MGIRQTALVRIREYTWIGWVAFVQEITSTDCRGSGFFLDVPGKSILQLVSLYSPVIMTRGIKFVN